MTAGNDDRQARVNRLRWRSRRGLLELDLILRRFWQNYGAELTDEDLDALEVLLEYPEIDFLDLVTGRKSSGEPTLNAVLSRLQAS